MNYTNIRNGLSELDSVIHERLFRVRNSSSSDAEIREIAFQLFHLDEYSDVFYSEAGDSIYMHYTYRDDEGLNIETIALPVWFVEDFDNHMAALN